MNKMVAAFIIALPLSACAPPNLQVEGVVRDKDTGTPIPSAYVVVNHDTGVTDALGHYNLTGAFQPGDTMMVNAPGYNIYTETIQPTAKIVDIDLSRKK